MGFLDDVFAHRNKAPPPDTPKTHIEGATEVTASTGPVATKGAPSANAPADSTPDTPTSPNRRWSLQRTLGFIRKAKSSDSETQDAHAPAASKAAEVSVKPASQSSTGPQAKESALALHALIVGQNTGDSSTAPNVRVSSAQLASIKAQLLQPETAIPVLAQLKALPAQANSASHTSLPVRAVALPFPDEEAADRHFSQLHEVDSPDDVKFHLPHTTIESIIETIKDLHIVNLFTAPDLGLGQSGDGPGLLAGAVPTAETVINGIARITPQLMALGFATGKSIVPDHTGIHPFVDRMSVLTYWWGLEILLPPPTMAYLGKARSISNTIMNFLTAISLMNEGAREILPFVRYISQYFDYEWDTIKAQDHGKGVICAATWIMPLALIPRPWDFPDPPPKDVNPPIPSATSSAQAPAIGAASTPTASGDKAAATSPSSPPVAA